MLPDSRQRRAKQVTGATISLVLMATALAPMPIVAQTVQRLSAMQISKIAALLDWKGVAVSVYPSVRVSLGMNADDSGLKQLTVIQRSAGVTHGIQFLPGAQGYLLIRKPGESYSDVYRLDMNFDELGSVRTSNVGDTSAIPADIDAAELRQELAFWSMAADTLPLPPPAGAQPGVGGAPAVSARGVPAASRPPLAVQLGAFGSEAAAREQLRLLQPLPAGLSVEISVARANGAQYYRAVVTGFADRPQAEAFCSARGIGVAACWVRPADPR